MFTKRFGIELEISEISHSDAARVIRDAGIPCEFEGYNHTDHVDGTWKVVRDSSVRNGCEVVSPVLCGEEGLVTARRVANALANFGATANRTCGFHVHFDATGMTVDHVRAIFSRYAKFEAEIDSVMPPSRRGDENRYCRSLAGSCNPEAFAGAGSLEQLAASQRDRYYKINLTSYLRHHTIEFRHHSGTCDAQKIENWVLFLSDFIDASAESASDGEDSDSFRSQMHRWPTWTRIYNAIRDNSGKTVAEIADAIGYTEGGLRAQVSRMRKNGCVDIRISRGHYIFDACRVQDTVYRGVRRHVREFYATRSAALAA